ncbi:MAG: class I SAM-dependent methyltransferase [Actinomycetota bacterium]
MTDLVTLEGLLVEKLSKEGPITFAEFMQAALYDQAFGYYRTHTPGIDSDYRTSPTLSPVFGQMMAVQLEQLWKRSGTAAKFTIAEAGGGNGALARTTLESVRRHPDKAEFADALEWRFIEPLESIANIQRQALSGLPGVEWSPTLDDMASFDGVILANEVLDNMPFHLVEITETGVVEIRIGARQGRLVEEHAAIQDAKLLERAAEARPHLEPGDRFEVGFEADEWVRRATTLLTRGCLFLIDYGDPEPDIWTRHPAGTVATYRRGQLGLNPLEGPGAFDITGHVNFSSLKRVVVEAGMSVEALVTQRQWLTTMGVGEAMKEQRDLQFKATERRDSGETLRLISERSRTQALIATGGLGSLKVFAASRA